MPDGDVISSSLHHRWRSTYRGLQGDTTPDGLARRALPALTDTLRSNGGIPGMAAYASVVAARYAGELTPTQARAQARLIAQQQEPTRFTLTVLKAVMACVADRPPDVTSLQPAELTVAEAVCRTVIDVELLEKVRPALVGERLPDHAACDRVISALHEALTPGITRIAERLQRDPTARRLRAAPPRRRAPRQSTADILNTPLL